MGVSISGGLPQTVLVALDYNTGEIRNQTRFPGSFTGVAGLSDQKDDALYISTLGLQYSKAGLKGVASISRFNQRLEFINAKEIIGAEASFPGLSCGAHGVNFLSYSFSKPFRGVGSAVNDNLEPVDVACPWTRGLKLAMEHCSYSSADVQCREEPLEVETGDGVTAVEPTSFNLVALALKLENAAETASAPRTVEQDRLPAGPQPIATSRYPDKAVPKDLPRALGDPKPVAYRAMGEQGPQPAAAQIASQNGGKPDGRDWGAILRQQQNELKEAWAALNPAQRESLRADEQQWEVQTDAEPFLIKLQSITKRAASLWHLAGNKERAEKNGW